MKQHLIKFYINYIFGQILNNVNRKVNKTHYKINHKRSF